MKAITRFSVQNDRIIVSTLDLTYNKLKAVDDFYNLINWPTVYTFFEVGNLQTEKF